MYNAYEHESDELDVFEATQYFYGEVDEMAGGLIDFHGLSLATEEREESSGVQQRKLDDEELVIGSGSPLSMVKDKRWKQPRSPGAKLVSFVNHFFSQVTSSRKLKCLNPSSSTREEEGKEDKEMQKSLANQSESSRSRNNAVRSRSSKSSVGSKPSNFCGSSSFPSPSSHKGIAESDFETWGGRPGGAKVENIGGYEETRWVLKPGSKDNLTRYWFHQGYQLPFSRASKEFTHCSRVRREEINGDDDDDDDDLFELKNIYAQEALSDGLPILATTSIEVTKRKTTISSTS